MVITDKCHPQVIENLDGLTNLNSIFLGKNRITKLQNMDSLINLKILGVQVSLLMTIFTVERNECFGGAPVLTI